MEHIDSIIGQRVRAEIPGGVTVEGEVVGVSPYAYASLEEDGAATVVWIVRDDSGEQFYVRSDEVTSI